jgi:hypothetical protein
MTILCVAATLGPTGDIASVSTEDATVPGSFQTGGEDRELTVADIDAAIGALTASATVLTWGGRRWFHRIGPASAARYWDHVDLEALFIGIHRFCVSLQQFTCCDEAGPGPCATLVTIVHRIADLGRLTWRSGASGRLTAFWTRNFYVPLGEVRENTAASWITEPVTVNVPTDAPRR